MHVTIALILRHLLSFRPRHRHQLPASPQQMLEHDLVRLLSAPRDRWQFALPPGIGLGAALRDLFQLYGALRYLYTGEKTSLYIAGHSLPVAKVPWLEIKAAISGQDTISVNGNGTLASFLPELPPGRCACAGPSKYCWTPALISWLAQRLWNFSELREGQYDIIARLLAGQNTLGILPTGAGKSLCFQLPAMLLPGITLVVSPLKSLMRDQYVNLCQAGISGIDFIDSSKTVAEKDEVLTKLRTGHVKLLYLSPERLQIEAFQQELAETMAVFPISLFAIDEAHCISEWGHDFRPSYLRLRHFVTQLKNPPLCALTATASSYVRQDILTLLGLNSQDMITPKTLDRKEISFQVKILGREDDYHQELTNILSNEVPQILNRSLDSIRDNGAGVVFAPYAAPKGQNTKSMGTEAISDMLCNQGWDCRHYHAQLPDDVRISIQDQFKENVFPLLIATKGYGMGIDKDNIDYVVHACAPASLEAYYQEAGRAGRDGEHAHSVILTRPRLEKCEKSNLPLPPCHQGWICQYTGGEKCDYGIQAGLLALEYPSEQETAQRFTRFLDLLTEYTRSLTTFRYTSPAKDSARHQKYLYYLQQLGAVAEFRVLEYRRAAANQFDMLLEVELNGPDSLANKYWLANKVVERIETYKAQKLNMLNTVQLYIKSSTCRRRFLMQYFGDKIRYERCNFCDIEGISPQAAPESSQTRRQEQFQQDLARALTEQNLALALALVEPARTLERRDELTVRALRELEDRPHNPAALFLAGIFAAQKPETEAYGLRNLQGAVDLARQQAPQNLPAIFASLAGESPDKAYLLARRCLKQLNPECLRELAVLLAPPEQYPDVHLALLLPELERINQLLKMEVAADE